MQQQRPESSTVTDLACYPCFLLGHFTYCQFSGLIGPGGVSRKQGPKRERMRTSAYQSVQWSRLLWHAQASSHRRRFPRQAQRLNICGKERSCRIQMSALTPLTLAIFSEIFLYMLVEMSHENGSIFSLFRVCVSMHVSMQVCGSVCACVCVCVCVCVFYCCYFATVTLYIT